eukprot:359459-Chlamydomonas_euryale.AAC.8
MMGCCTRRDPQTRGRRQPTRHFVPATSTMLSFVASRLIRLLQHVARGLRQGGYAGWLRQAWVTPGGYAGGLRLAWVTLGGYARGLRRGVTPGGITRGYARGLHGGKVTPGLGYAMPLDG